MAVTLAATALGYGLRKSNIYFSCAFAYSQKIGHDVERMETF
jgi:hypothetical protein